MKRTALIVLFLGCFFSNIFAAEKESVSAVILGYPTGTEWNMHILLNNNDDYVAFQMDVALPKDITGISVEEITSRLDKGANVTIGGASVETPFVLSWKPVSETETNKVIRVLAYNLGNNAISGDSGDHIIRLSWKSNSEMAYTAVSASCSNIIFVKSSELSGVSLDFDSLNNMLLGDANIDGSVSVADFTAVANTILGNTPEHYSKLAADVNFDDGNSVSDLTGIANIILNGSVSTTTSSEAKAPISENVEKIKGE